MASCEYVAGEQAVYQHSVKLSVTVEIHRPCVFYLIVVRVQYGCLKIYVHKYILICLFLEHEWCALGALHTVAHRSHGQFATVWDCTACGLEVCFLHRLSVHFCVFSRSSASFVDVVSDVFRLLRQLSP